MEKLYTIPEASEVTRMSIPWWRLKILQRQVKFLRIGRRTFIPESTIKAIFENGVIEPITGSDLNGVS